MGGKIISLSGPTVTTDLTGLKLYDRVAVGENGLTGEAVRLDSKTATIQVYEDTRGLALGESVVSRGESLSVSLGPGLLGVMFDGLQRPLAEQEKRTGPFIGPVAELTALNRRQGLEFVARKKPGDPVRGGDILGFVREGAFEHAVLVPPGREGIIARIDSRTLEPGESVCTLENGEEIGPIHSWPVRRPRPYRQKLSPGTPVVTGQRIIDFLFPLARGGTAMIPGGFGTGKTILEQTIAKYADVDIVIYVGCGERGNEMSEMIEEFRELSDPRTGRSLMERTVMVVNTSNMPVAAREASIYTAVTMGEYYRDLGFDVLLLADSISRWAEALREISSSLEEMPGEEGYPTYLASRLASFVERAGVVETFAGRTGSLSMILSVSPPGGDFTEPVTQALLRTAGSFLVLDTGLANARHFPAINWGQSYSLYEEAMTGQFTAALSGEWQEMRARCREVLRRELALKEIVEIVGLEGMQERDRLLLDVAERIRGRFLAQNAYSPPQETLARIREILIDYAQAEAGMTDGAETDAAG